MKPQTLEYYVRYTELDYPTIIDRCLNSGKWFCNYMGLTNNGEFIEVELERETGELYRTYYYVKDAGASGVISYSWLPR